MVIARRGLLVAFTVGVLCTRWVCGDGRPSDFIDYAWLVERAEYDPQLDSLPHFRKLFHSMEVRGLLECGCGYITKYFIDCAGYVVSAELLSPESREGFREWMRFYRGSPSWMPFLYNADFRNARFNDAALCVERGGTPSDRSYREDLVFFFKKQINMARAEGRNLDVAVVHPYSNVPKDCVELLLEQKIPVVISHGCRQSEGERVCFWDGIETPRGYERIDLPWGSGMTLWIHQTLSPLIRTFAVYRAAIDAHEEPLSLEVLTGIADRPPKPSPKISAGFLPFSSRGTLR